MKWRKLGQIFCPDGHHKWMHSHAANPLPLVLQDLVRVFFSCRDAENQSYVGYVDLDPANQFKVVDIAQEPALGPGRLGTFDDSGISIGCLQETAQGTLLYYMGWNLKVKVPWGNAIGVARLAPSGRKFEDRRLAPLLDRSEDDPYTLSYPCVIRHQDRYLMYYGSSLDWGEGTPTMTHVIKIAESRDAINWKRDGRIAIDLRTDGEYALSRPWARRTPQGLEMFYTRRGSKDSEAYRLGYAVSNDGLNWERRDREVGITVADQGWDSEMIGYPALFDYREQTYLLYAGNGYGKTGFGLAVLESA